MSTIAEIAEAVKDALNAASDSSFVVEAERVWTPVKDQTALVEDQMTVLVFPVLPVRTNETRGTFRTDVEIHIWYAQRLSQNIDPSDPASNVLVDPLAEFAEDLGEVIKPGQRHAEAICLRIEQDPLYDFDRLYSHRTFNGVVKAFFMRSKPI